jgi:hypothetical protein
MAAMIIFLVDFRLQNIAHLLDTEDSFALKSVYSTAPSLFASLIKTDPFPSEPSPLNSRKMGFSLYVSVCISLHAIAIDAMRSPLAFCLHFHADFFTAMLTLLLTNNLSHLFNPVSCIRTIDKSVRNWAWRLFSW